jgi:hypothetical protein
LREATGYTEMLLRRELGQLVETKLLLEVGGWFLALALRPRDELVRGYLGTGSVEAA